MTKVQNPIIGRSSGQAGGMVFQKMYDKNVMRAKPFEVRDAKSPAQILNREVAALVTAIAKGFSKDDLIKMYPNYPTTRSRYAELLSELQRGRDVSGSVGTLNFDDVDSFGNGISFEFPSLVATSVAPNVGYDWDATDNPYVSSNDPIFFLLIDTTSRKMILVDLNLVFDDETASINVETYGMTFATTTAYICAVAGKYKAGADLTKIVK